MNLEEAATAAAGATPSSSLTIVAKSLKFDKKALVAPANTAVTVKLDNQDNNVLHDISFYRAKDLEFVIHRGEAFEGNKAQDETFTTPSAGVFYFRCDVHPDMEGAFVVR